MMMILVLRMRVIIVMVNDSCDEDEEDNGYGVMIMNESGGVWKNGIGLWRWWFVWFMIFWFYDWNVLGVDEGGLYGCDSELGRWCWDDYEWWVGGRWLKVKRIGRKKKKT